MPWVVICTGVKSQVIAQQIIIHSGADYVSKSGPLARGFDTIVAVTPGQTQFPYLDAHPIYDHPMIELTWRGLKVLSAFAMGWMNEQIAPGQ